MTWQEFIIEICDKAAWPVVVMLIAILFKDFISGFLIRLKEVTTRQSNMLSLQLILLVRLRQILGVNLILQEKSDLKY